MLEVKGNTLRYKYDFKLSLWSRITLLFRNNITVHFYTETVKNGDKLTTKADCRILLTKPKKNGNSPINQTTTPKTA